MHGWTLPLVFDYAPTLYLGDTLLPWRQRYPGVTVVEKAVVGPAAAQLLHEAAAADAGLVVVGRRIRSSPVGAHVGSITHAVMHHCATPVAVVSHV
ncbi:universal stress protein [Streptomyces sp. NPDC002889]|uniref:universal stress protein n=1 Tax=Streptomyces sp. NPDC002889 TaxID=3364669 RepID=UPI0036BA54A0